MRPLLLAVGVLLAAGCAGGEEESSPPATATARVFEDRCTRATSDLMTPLANKLTVADARLTNGWILESNEHDDVYLVAAEIDSPELPSSGDIGVWATTSPHGAEAIYTVNMLAARYTDWRDADAIGLSEDDEDVAEARGCVSR